VDLRAMIYSDYKVAAKSELVMIDWFVNTSNSL
jgi:hypothetical protein